MIQLSMMALLFFVVLVGGLGFALGCQYENEGRKR